MEALITSEYRWLWTVVLGAMLFLPVRHLIWVMSVRRHERRTGKNSDEETRTSMKRRAAITSALLCLVFATTYVAVLLADAR
jgi:hypothetical protein